MASPSSPKKGLMVIGAGLGRTGTDSLRDALSILLDAPCYHMLDLLSLGDPEATKWVESSLPDWSAIFDSRTDNSNYKAAVDYPACAYVEELIKRYPDALVILSKRKTATDWVKSAEATIIHAGTVVSWINFVTFGLIRSVAVFAKLVKKMYLRTLGFEPHQATHERLLHAYNQWNSHVEQLVPKNRLLIYTVGDGWEPLCKALKVAVPSVPYPNKNNTQDFQNRFQNEMRSNLPKKLMTWGTLLLLGIYIGIGTSVYYGGKYIWKSGIVQNVFEFVWKEMKDLLGCFYIY